MKYSPNEDEAIRDGFAAGQTWGEIGGEIGRDWNSIRNRAYRLGLSRPEKTTTDAPTKSTIYNRRWQRKFPEKRRAHKSVEFALASGRLEKQPCKCGREDVHAHHRDYSKPLDVEWLCPLCHKAAHRTEK